MLKIKFLVTILLTILTFNLQVEAKEIKPLFGIYKIVSNESSEFLNQSYTEIFLTSEAEKNYPKLGNAIKKYSEELKSNAKIIYEKYYKEAAEFQKEYPGESRQFYNKNEIIIRRADSVVLSLMEMNEDYTGGVHGMYGYFGVNFDSESGKQLKISDVCDNNEKLLNAILTRLHEDYPQSPFADAEKYILKQIVEEKLNFTIEPDGISIYFNPYEIGCYAEGLFTATILFSEYPNLFKNKYFQLPKNYCQMLPLYNANILSFKRGIRNYIQVTLDDKGNYKVLTGGGVAEDQSGLEGIKPPVLVHLNGKNFLYVDGYIEGKGRQLHVYEVSDKKIELIYVLPYTFKNLGTKKYETWYLPTDPENISFDSLEKIGNTTNHSGAINDDGSFSFG